MPEFLVKHRTLLAIALVAAIALAAYGVRRVRGVEVDVIQVRPQPFLQTVIASGRVMPPARVEIGSVVTGRVVTVLVREGDRVQADQVLVELERAELEAALRQAEAGEQTAKARVSNVAELGLVTAEEALAQAKSTLDWQAGELKRYRELRASGFIGEAKLDEVRRAYDVAKSQYDAARTQMNSQTKSGVQAREALARLREATAARELAAAKLAQATIRASAAGLILTRQVEPGDIVQPGKSLLTLASAGETRITAQIDEKNLPYLKVGAAAVASADAFPDAKFNAALYYIAPGVDAQRGAVEARFNVPEPPAHLRADMTLSIEITGSRKEQALVVPLEAVRSAGNGGSAVLVANSDHATSRPVKLGLRGDGKVEVAEGLQAGEQVILNAAIVPGTRVRVHVVDPARVAERAS